jgi:hypothetical protein
LNKISKTLGSIGALGALALGGSALADAATNTTTSTTTTPKAGQAAPKAGQAAPKAGQGSAATPRGPRGRHVGANGKREQALDAGVAKKVADAALAKVTGGTVERTETDVDHASPYEAHVRKADGTEVEVLVNESFDVTAVNAMR